MKYHELPTPALTIDLDILECNLDRMAAYCREHGIGLRPHTKTHKVPEVGRMQVERGAVGLTVAKVGEAEVMAGAGLDDILIAFPIWGEEKLRRIAAIARERTVLLSLDNEATAEGLSQAASAAGATVGAGGNVQNVSTSGEPRGYRGLASCIASRVRGWTFPASSGTTTVNVPFVFAAQ